MRAGCSLFCYFLSRQQPTHGLERTPAPAPADEGVAARQALDAREGCLAAGLAEAGLAERAAEDLAALLAAAGVEWHVRADEAAAALAGWADAALLRSRCPAGLCLRASTCGGGCRCCCA